MEIIREIETFWIDEQIIITKNIDVKKGVINGSIGEIIELNANSVRIKLTHNQKIISLDIVESRGTYCYKKCIFDCIIRSIPITQGYFITVHKYQGMTLKNVIIDIQHQHFSHGMFYVALSRVKQLTNLSFLGTLHDLKYAVEDF